MWPEVRQKFAAHLAAMREARAEHGRGSAGIGAPKSRDRRIIFDITACDRLGEVRFKYHATKGWRVRAL